MLIAVDAMGGDLAPGAAVAGAAEVAASQSPASILLVGREPVLRKELERHGGPGEGIEIVHTDEVVAMDEPAITPIRKKRRSSVRICAQLVKEGRAQAMVTAGNTGAAMITAKLVMGAIPGVDRPALAAVLPNAVGRRTVLLDVGANVDSKPEHLRQFAVMGHSYAQAILHTAAPRVGLMSIGEEEGKGSDLTREVFKALKEAGLNFVGNVEGGDVFSGAVDVIVTDGFVGNVVLKSSEALAEMVGNMLRDELVRSSRTRMGYLLAKPGFDAFRTRTDYREFGAAPLLGVNGGCLIAHGRSNGKAIASSIRRAIEFCSADLHTRIRHKVAELHSEEAKLLVGQRKEAG